MTTHNEDKTNTPRTRMPAIFAAHGAPMLLDDTVWMSELGSALGWQSPIAIGLAVATLVAGGAFFRIETGNAQAFVGFRLFQHHTGATLSNFLMNATVGIQLVSLQLVQMGGGMSAQQAGLLTLGYGIAIIAFIRAGEKLLQRFGPRRPMVWGCMVTGVAIACLMPTHLMVDAYRIVAMVGYTLFGLGLAFYATPPTDAALSSLPMDQAGSGTGIYKMASSLGAAFGVNLGRDLHRARPLRRQRPVAGRSDHVRGLRRRRRAARGGDRGARLQSVAGRGCDRLDHAHDSAG
jgi:hypothetical protein